MVSQKTREGNLSFNFQMESLEMKSIVIELKISLDEINSKCELADERIYNLEDRSIEMI